MTLGKGRNSGVALGEGMSSDIIEDMSKIGRGRKTHHRNPSQAATATSPDKKDTEKMFFIPVILLFLVLGCSISQMICPVSRTTCWKPSVTFRSASSGSRTP